jgi:hypothetical protein
LILIFIIKKKIITPLSQLVDYTHELTNENYKAKEPKADFIEIEELINWLSSKQVSNIFIIFVV